MINNTKEVIIKSIAIYQLLFGLINIVLYTIDLPNRTLTIFLVIGYILFIIQFLAGLTLLLNKKGWLFLSFIIQFLQIISFRFENIGYYFCSGIHLSFSNENDKIGFVFKPLDITYQILLDNTDDFTFWINIIPIIVIFLLSKIYFNVNDKESLIK